MLSFFSKNAFKYFLLVRYRKSLFKILISLLLIIVAHFLYNDVSDSLKISQEIECQAATTSIEKNSCISQKDQYRLLALVIKWVTTLLSAAMIIFTLNPVNQKSKSKPQKNNIKSNQKIKNLLAKKKLKSEADLIWQELDKKPK